jgi:hypothetical protein
MVQSGHIEGIIEIGSNFGEWSELFIFLIKVFELVRHLGIVRFDVMFVPLLDEVVFDDLSEISGFEKQSLDHLYWLIYNVTYRINTNIVYKSPHTINRLM